MGAVSCYPPSFFLPVKANQMKYLKQIFLQALILIPFLLIANYSIGQNIWANDTSICFDKVYGSELIFYHKKGVVYKQMYEGCLDTITRYKTKIRELESDQLMNYTVIQGKDLKIQKEKNKNKNKLLFIISENAILIIATLILL